MLNFPSLNFIPFEFSNCCSRCQSKMHKHGKSGEMKQRYRCTQCGLTQVENYSYMAYQKTINHNLVALLKAGVGIRACGRLLKISPSTVMRRIRQLAAEVKPPPLRMGKTYEVDELCTFYQKKAGHLGSECLLQVNPIGGTL